MRLTTLSFHNFTRFDKPVTVDWTALPRGLIAVTGDNGEGKSSLIEMVPGAIYRKFPSHEGKLADSACDRNAFIELEFEFEGEKRQARLNVDAKTRDDECKWLKEGKPVTSGQSGHFNEYRNKFFVPETLFYASIFAVQNKSGNFLTLGKAERKDLIISMLGLEHLQVIAKAAAEEAETAKIKAQQAEREYQEAQAKIQDLNTLEENTVQFQQQVAELQEELVGKRTRWQALVEEEARTKSVLERVQELRQRLLRAVRQREDLNTKKAVLEGEQAECNRLVAQTDTIRNAAKEIEKLEEQLGALQTEIERLEKSQAEAIERNQERTEVQNQIRAVDDQLREMLETAKQAQREKADAVQAEIQKETRTKLEAENAIRLDQQTIDQRQKERERCQKQADILKEIPCGDSQPGCLLIRDAREARDRLTELNAQVEKALAQKQERETALTTISTRVQELEEKRAEILACDVTVQTSEGATLQLDRETLQVQLDEMVQIQVDELTKELTEKRNAVSTTRSGIQSVKEKANQLPALKLAIIQLAKLETVVTGITQELQEVRGEYDQIEQEIQSLEAKKTIEEITQERQRLETEIKVTETTLQQTRNVLAQVEAKLDELRALVPIVEIKKAERDRELNEVEEWLHLSKAFGRDGIQALEIDAAGPEVSRLTNDLLEACFGTRFSMTFETTKEKQGKKGEMKEVFDIVIWDHVRNRQGDIKSFSGGEKVILNEALSLGLAIFNCRKSGKRFETLFRDETSGELDPKNAMRYLHMLRKAQEVGNFHQVIFIAHQPQLWEEADARLVCADGKVTVE